MNYFEIFDLPVTLKVDKSSLSKKYFDLLKKYHPDYFGNASAEEQQHALELSSEVNKAFKTFQSQDDTIRYVLQLKGLLEDEGKFKLPPDFLMEVMELNELKMDEGAPEEIVKRANLLQEKIFIPVSALIGDYRDGVTNDSTLEQVKTYYYKKKYIDRLLAV